MFAVYADRFSKEDPLSALQVGERPDPEVPDGWTTVTVKAASLNHHDLFSLRGVGLREEALPMILGCDAAGLDEDGNEVVVHAVISDPSWTGDETFDPKRSLLSERYQGTLADKVAVPRRNVVPKPASLSFEEAACLPTAWLTAYRMLFTRGELRAGETVLVQGAGGGVATAAIVLGRAAGLRVLVTSRDEAKRARALELGAHDAFESGARLPVKVDAVIETVGRATWSHSIRALRPGGRIVTSGTTSGPNLDDAELTRIFFLQLSVIGSTMGTRDELAGLVSMLDATGARPLIDRTLPMERGARRVRGDARRRAVRQDRLHPMRHLVTGAGSGIGAVLAQRLLERGDEVVVLARSAERAEEMAADLPGVEVLVADLAWPESVESLALPDSLDSVVHAAGVVELGSVAELSVADWADQLRVNLVAPAALTRVALPALRQARGTVVFVNSGAGLSRPPAVVGVRRLEARPACARRLAARRGGRVRRTRHARSIPAAPRPRCRRRCTSRRARSTTPPPGSVPRPSPRRSCTCSTCPATRRSPT